MSLWLKILCLISFLFSGVPAPAQEISLGCYIPMTGSAAAMGQVVWKGIEIAQRLKPEVLGKKIKLVLLDTKSDKIEAANAVSRLIERDKVAAIIGEVISGDTLAGAPIAERFAIPNITPTATNPLVTQNRQYAFRACFVDTLQGKVAARFAKEHLKAQKAAIIIDQAQDYCVGLANFFTQEFKQKGGQIVATTYIQTGDQDFSAQISAIKPMAPDIIYAPNYYAEDALLARQMQELGLSVPILTGDGAQVTDLITIGGPAVEGMYFTAHFHRETVKTPLAQEFIKAYEAATKREVEAFAALGGDCYFLLVSALERAQTTEGPKLRQALAQTKDFPGVSGSITMGPDNNPIKEVHILQVKGGEFVFVTKMAP
jgi:branched-chain amino acid transport system substrate-binding protein